MYVVRPYFDARDIDDKVYVKSNGIPVTGIEILETEVLLPENDSKIIVATILPKNATNQNISWKSNDNSVATIRDGKITGVKEGTTTIVASTLDGNYKKEIKVRKRTPGIGLWALKAIEDIQIDKVATPITLSKTWIIFLEINSTKRRIGIIM